MDKDEIKKLISNSLDNNTLRDFEFNSEKSEVKFIYKNDKYTVTFTQSKGIFQIVSVDGLYSNKSADLIKICIEKQIKINLLESELLKYKKKDGD